jgi:glycosyltransferase involved in cell wall biosynthesis
LPPVLLLPCVHAAGELRWHRKESAFALKSEPWWRHRIVRANLIYRSRLQRKTLSKVYGQLGMSKRFNELMQQDYGVRVDRQAVVYQPMPPQQPPEKPPTNSKVKLVFVGRISVRKGIDLLIDLSNRLDDLANEIEIEVIGGASFWSDYTRNLSKLNPRLTKYVGAKPHDAIMKTFGESDLLLVPSQYEPGGIVVAEALSQGCRVVVSEEVGSAEPLAEEACYRFPAGDISAFERACRDAIRDSQTDREQRRRAAIRAAETSFGMDQAIEPLVKALSNAAARQPLQTVTETIE